MKIAWTGAAVVAAAVLLGSIGAVALAARPATERAESPHLKIALVAPREPTPIPGSVMPVGALRDDYVHDPAALRPPASPDLWMQVAWIEPPSDLPAPDDVAFDAPPSSSAASVSVALDPGDRSFGFDAPRPDYAAEREIRRARLDAVQRESAAQADLSHAPSSTAAGEDLFF